MYKYEYSKLNELANTEKGKKLIDRFEKCYKETYQGKTMPVLTYSLFKDYYRTGNRCFFQAEYFDRRKRLMLLQVLALNNDEYLEDLEQVIFEICNEFTWVLPAHNYKRETNSFDYERIDLFACETAFYLAETAFVLKDKLCPDILNRIKLSLKTKIIDNYEKHPAEEKYNHFDKTHNNWTAVCACAIGLTYLYAFPERFERVKERVFNGLKRYIDGFGNDGYSGEGFGYWSYGFGFFCIFYDVYNNLFNEKPEILNGEKMQNILNYGVIAQISPRRYLPFADGGTVGEHEPGMLVCVIEQLFNKQINLDSNYPIPNTKALGYRALYSVAGELELKESTSPDFYYFENSQVYINKKHEYSFVAKGGNNHESHNHNDVGVFQVIKDGKIIIADLGVGEYTKDYFSHAVSETYRYSDKVFVCSSISHSVPFINGDTQKYGEEYFAKLLACDENKFKLDIKKAYAQDIDELTVEYTLQENQVDVEYVAKGVQSFTARFISIEEPILLENGVMIHGAKLFSQSGIKPVVQKVGYRNQQCVEVYAYTIDFAIDGQNINQKFTLSL